MNWYKKSQASQQIDWTKEQGRDILNAKQRDIVNYLVKFHPDEWVYAPTLLEELGFEHNYFYLILKGLLNKDLIMTSYDGSGSWNNKNIRLTDKGKYF